MSQFEVTVPFRYIRDDGSVMEFTISWPDPHGAMLAANTALPDGDPFKVTRADIDALRDVLGTNRDDAPDYTGMLDSLDVARAAVGKLAALLPPE